MKRLRNIVGTIIGIIIGIVVLVLYFNGGPTKYWCSHLTIRGMNKIEQGNSVDALNSFNRAIELCPSDDSIWFARGKVKWLKLNDLSGAMEDFSKGLELNSGNALHFALMGSLSIDVRKMQQKRIDGFTNVPKYILGGQQMVLNAAVVSFSRAIDLDASVGEYYFNRGYAYMQLKEYGKGCQDYKRSLSLGMTAADFGMTDNELQKSMNTICKT